MPGSPWVPGSPWATRSPWAKDVLRFWFEETAPEKWFQKDAALDAAVRARFARTHEHIANLTRDDCLTDPQTALAAVIVLDQFSRNMFRGAPRAFASDPQALRLAEAAIGRGFDVEVPEPARLFFYLPLQHAEDAATQKRCVGLMAMLADPGLMKWAEAHKAIIDRFGRFPHRNAILGRKSTVDELDFLTRPGSSF
ncbi:MAG TPA: DUF924 family protein [Hyphomicrobiaceae bacterium]|nr:DUF924 family protein [Hyphomicrobiaceae bacterium]